jgi:hypothetical protein
MGATTPFLNLYKPGGGSSGTNTPDEVMDIDRINGNFDMIDAGVATLDERVGEIDDLFVGMNRQYYGTAAARATLTGMRRGDTYKESNGSFYLWRYTGTGWLEAVDRPTLAVFRKTVAQNLAAGPAQITWRDTAPGLDTGGFYDATDAGAINLVRSGYYRISVNLMSNTATSIISRVDFRINGAISADNGEAPASKGETGAGAGTNSTDILKANAGSYLKVWVTTTSPSGAWVVGATRLVIEYLGNE